MKKSMLVKTGLIILFNSIITLYSVAQTAGTFTFNITTTSTTGYSPKHLVAIWIEDNSGTFIKTKAKYSTDPNLDHLAIWTGKSSSNVVDATTGATLLTHGALTVIWNGTDVNGSVVADGTYKVWIEMAWAASLTTGKTSTSFSFTKGSSSFHSAPASTANFSGITLDWLPGATSAIESKLLPVTITPNPTKGPVTIAFNQKVGNCVIVISSIDGKEKYHEVLKSVQGSKIVDLSKYSNGIYFVSVRYNDKNLNFRVVKK